jgi:D,D-heptose 1,7-bisphosphate phosphatase
MKPTKAILLGAGLGTRLRPLTQRVTKCLVPIAGRPLLDYWVEQIVHAGITEVLLNTHHLAEQVREYIQMVNAKWHVRLIEFHEPQLLGSAGTLAANPQFAQGTENVVIIYADNFSNVNLLDLLKFHQQHAAPFTMMLFHAPNPRACGIAELDSQNRIISFAEKPQHPKSDFANAGLYVVSAKAYEEIAALKAFDLGFEVLPKFVGRMRGWVWNGYHRDMGTYATYLQAQRDAVELLQRAGKLQGCQPAVFLDRDGTLIEQVHYLSNPQQVKLLPGAGDAVKRLRAAGFACIVVTNQSPIGQGLLTETQLAEIHAELFQQLAQCGTQVDGVYYCPAAPLVKDRTTVDHYDRKPGPGMLFKAAADLHLDLTRSWMIGDMLSDILAGYHAHCEGLVLVTTGKGLEGEELSAYLQCKQVTSLAKAADLICHQ